MKVGDAIKVDDTIVEISTDKVDLELPAPASGTVSEILVAEGDTVTVGQVIARIARRRGAEQARSDSGRRAPHGQPRRAAAAASDRRSASPEGTKVSPVAARAAAVEGVDLGAVSRQRPGGADHQVRRARSAPPATARAATQRRGATARGASAELAADEGRRGGARPLHGAVALDPDGDELPHAHRDACSTRAGAS